MIAWHEKHDKYKLVSGYQTLDVNTDAHIIRCKVRVEGFLYAYVIGDFNQWKKSEAYRLEWQANSNDGSLAMMDDIVMPSDLHDGVHKYSYMLIDVNGAEALLSVTADKFEPFEFTWVAANRHLEIKASQNTLSAGSLIDLVAIRNIGHNQREIADVTWRIEPPLTGIQIHNNRLQIDDGVYSQDSVILHCIDQKTNELASRTFSLSNTPNKNIKVHYLRRDNCYNGSNFIWDLWAYHNDGSHAEAINFSELTDFGMVAIVSHDFIIARKKAWDFGWQNDWSEQSAVFAINREEQNYYIIDGDASIYTNLSDVIFRTNPRIDLALLDHKNKIVASLSNIPPIGTKFYLYINQIRQDKVTSIIKDDLKQVIFLDIPKSLRANDFVTVEANNTFLPCTVTMRSFLDRFYYNGHDMGCHFIDDKISLRLWAPTAKYVELLIYDDFECEQTKPTQSMIMFCEPANGTHHIQIVATEFENKAYLYRLYFDDLDSAGHHKIRVNYAIDPYANGIGVNGGKGCLLNINDTSVMPENWHNDVKPPLVNKQDAIITELHVRDFTIQAESGVKNEWRGKYLGFVESGCKYTESNQSVTTGIDSLVELGITHVHLLPIFDFSSVDERKTSDSTNRNWGYDPANYNAPEGSYSSNPFNPSLRILEVRTMIHKLHQQGLRVVMDMVYNHMTDTANMDRIVPGYYFRTDESGKFTNGSGCGNELATEHPMVRKFVIDSILHWIRDYHIDGTRFDLMELMDFDTMLLIVKSVNDQDPSLLVYGEPWKGGHSPLTNGTFRGRQKDNHFSIFNDIFRDAIRGTNNPNGGFVNGNQHNPLNLWHVIEGLKGSISGLTAHAYETINYVDAHDNYTLWDQIEKSQNMTLENGNYRQNLPVNIMESTLVRQNMLALGIILTAQGIPFFHGGAEVLRTKNGDHNSYKSDDLINQFYWQDKLKFKSAFDYVKGLILLRKRHPAFRMQSAKMINDYLSIIPAYNNDRSGVIVSHYKNNANDDEWENIIVIYNATAFDHYDVNPLLPCLDGNKQWTLVVNHEIAGINPIAVYHANKVAAMRAFSMYVLHD